MAIRLAAAILTATLLASCQSPSDRSEVAAEYVTAYLRAASRGDQDRGWWMIDQGIRSAMYGNDINAYLAVVKDADWTGFAWQVAHVTPEDSFEFVWVELMGGNYPAYLIQPRGTHTFAAGDGAKRMFSVRFGWFGARTLFASGG